MNCGSIRFFPVSEVGAPSVALLAFAEDNQLSYVKQIRNNLLGSNSFYDLLAIVISFGKFVV